MLKKQKIAIVNSSSLGQIFPEHLTCPEKIGTMKHLTVGSEIGGKELVECLQGYMIIIANVMPFLTREFFEHKDELLLISCHGIGYNNIDLDAAKQHGTIVSIIPVLVERDAVAENNATDLLAVLRQTVVADASVKTDQWEKRVNFIGRTLFNKIVGVIGVGSTGSHVMETLWNGFRCDVLAYDSYKSATYLWSYGVRKVDLDTLLASADIICLCVNLTEGSYHMIGSAEIAKMKDDVYLSNSAWGALIGEEAMIAGLQPSKIAGFGTDVLEEGPGRKNYPYLVFENIVMTPYTSAYAMECL